ncbi:Katanin p60 ATPase-containing subunit A1 [Tritrichomonas foetus]|uniref:Katanin p60 ATPase-containing subunit A1 n=1 Tax=Tritrichomonas foetus TaxID=1144522 RepID=A0A1J4KKB9_9EUKA|nr:Katanin p60 ATPase-containing subunit A1 [Tritrichomonas foetus]|eukprot:OHT10284.1 Katanin p60 ATPase-containing subunit A1 [Tritrichomonas foetus]
MQMDESINPILRNVREAREYGKIGNYAACFQSYANAKELIKQELNRCRNSNEHRIWNAFTKEIVGEELAIRRLREAIDDTLEALNSCNNPRLQSFKGDDIASSKPDFNIVPKIIDFSFDNAPRRNYRKLPSIKHASVSHDDNGKFQPGPGPINNPQRSAPKVDQRGAASREREKERAENNKPLLVPKGDPNAYLKQQIIDMGILEKEPNVLWDSIAGLPDVKRLLRQNLVILPMRPDIAKGLLAPWKTVLFYGPPGTGKTFLAKAVATECKRVFFNITSAQLTSKFHGESEKLVGYLFDLAEQMAPSTIFFDEIDSLASQRGSQNEHEASRKMKAQLLTKLSGLDAISEESNVFVLAATNFPWDLDEALLRRFQKRIYIPLPDLEGRISLLEMNLSDLADVNFDIDGWAKKLNGYSCADIANLCRDAAQMVFTKQTSMYGTDQWLHMAPEDAKVIITNEDFAQAVAARKSSVDKEAIQRYEAWKRAKGAE